MSLYDELMSINLQGRVGESLNSMISLAKIRPASHRKADVVEALNTYLSSEKNIIDIWKGLEEYEQDLLIEYLRAGALDTTDVQRIFFEHELEDPIERRYSFHSYSLSSFFQERSKALLFFMGGRIPHSIRRVLEQFVPPYVPSYTPIESLPMDDLSLTVEIGETFEIDFVRLLRLINKENLKVTKVKQLPTKASMKKMNAVLFTKEWLTTDNEDVHEIRNIEQSTRLYGLFKLLEAAQLITTVENKMVLGPQAKEFLQSNPVDKCAMLLNGYLESQEIIEIERIPEDKYMWSYSNFTKTREVVLEHLASCPVNEWIAIDELTLSIKRVDRSFLQSNLGEISIYDSYYNYYYQCGGWSRVHERYIQIVLLEYLAMMGIVHVALNIEWGDYDDSSYYQVCYLRLTPLGGHLLGVHDEYSCEESQKTSGLVIQPNFEILVSEGSMKDVHCLFFDSFAEKVSNHPTPIYLLSFKAIVQALEEGIRVEDILDYLQRHKEHPLPENVLSTIKNWSKESERIKIRKATILETDDPYLVEELKSYKTIHRHIEREIKHSLEIDEKDAKKIKREIEKKGRFCLLEE